MKKSSLLFLILFFLMIFVPIPVFSLFREQIGYKNTENKAETAFPDLTRRNFSTWPKRFEDYLSDSLPFKTQFIELFRSFQLKCGLDFTQSDVIRGKDDILFYRKTKNNYKGLKRFSDDELAQMTENLESFFTEMENRGVRCLFYIAPDKEQVYSDRMPENILRVTEKSMADQTVDYMRENMAYPVLYPKAELRELSQTLPIYYDTDTHWNNLGGWAAARQIKEAFSGEPEDMTPPEFHRYESEGKDLAGMLGISELLPENNAIEIDYDDGLGIFKTQTINYGSIQRFTSDDTDLSKHKRLMVIGDSFSEHYVRAALHDIKDILFVTYGDLGMIDFEAEIPEYLVIMLVERNLPFLLSPVK